MNRLGNWISGKSQTPFYARREFNIKKQVQKATAYVCGLGQFIFHINGQKVSDHELDPGWTNYDKKIQYVKFDVTKLLHEGKNALGVEVGNGWFLKEGRALYIYFSCIYAAQSKPIQTFWKGTCSGNKAGVGLCR